MGASYQLIPIVLERQIWSERLARWQLAILAVAVTGMVAHFQLGTWPGLAAAAGLLAIGIALHLLNVGMSLRGFTRWTFTARLVVLAYGGLALTTVFGLALAANRVWPFLPGELFPTLHAHVHLALLGWVAPMILAVAARVYPMFFLAPAPRRWHSFLQLWGLAAGVPAVVLGLLGVPGLLVAGALAVAAAAGAHVAWVCEMAWGRKRPGLDWGLRFVLTATAFLAPAAVLGVALATDRLAGPRVALAYAVVMLGGWISLTIVGHDAQDRPVPGLVPRVQPAGGPRAGAHARADLLAARRGAGLRAPHRRRGAAGRERARRARPPGSAPRARVLALGALAFAAALGRVLGCLHPGAQKWPPRSAGRVLPKGT